LTRSQRPDTPKQHEEEAVQLTVRDVSKFLNVPEATVTRWIKQRGLPARHVAGQYRCNRAELLEWAVAHWIDVKPELFDPLEAEEEPVPALADALEAGGIFYKLPDSTKEKALRALVQVLPLPAEIDRELLFRLLLAREAAASTGIGDGIALPHVRNPIVLHVTRPLVTLCFLEHAVDFGALDGKPVQILFSLICPTTRSHLQLLARLSHALHDPAFRAVVQRHERPEVILQEARRMDAALAAPAGEVGKAAH
jgi:PTS system nitrogen regulatory IIA component